MINKILQDSLSVNQTDNYFWTNPHTEEVIRENLYRANYRENWRYICFHQKLSEDFIREFKNKVNWTNISCCQNLSEEFIRENKDKVDWLCISRYQKLSEKFIREFQDKVIWYYISCDQELSEEFRKEFAHRFRLHQTK